MQVGIVPRDFETSMSFYRDKLKLPYRGSNAALDGRTLHFFEAQGAFLKLLAPAEGGRSPAVAPAEDYHAVTGFRWLTLDVEDLEEAMRACEGAHIQLPATELRPGLWVAIISDPDGNAVELVQGANRAHLGAASR